MPTLYDEDQQAEPGYVPDDDELRSVTGISKSEEKGMDARGYENNAAEKTERNALGLDSDPNNSGPETGSAAKDKLAGNAAAAAATAVGGPAAGRLAKTAAFFWGTRRRRRATIGGGIGAGSITGIIIGFIMFMAPLKVVSMVQNWQDHFSAAGEQATQDMTEKLMQHYLVQKVMPGMVDKKCRSSLVSKSCAKVSDSSTVVGQLFEAWRTANLEGKMANDYGIEIIRTNDNKFYLKTPNLSDRISIGNFNGDSIEFEGKAFAALNRTEFRREYRAAIKGATSWKQMYHRHGMSKLAVDKYGARLCLFACTARGDRARDSIDAKKMAFKAYLNERVIAPRSEMYSLALQCAMNSFGCGEGDLVEDNGEHTNNFDRDLRAKLISVRDRFGQERLDQILSDSEEIRNKGVTQYLTDRLIGEAAGQATRKAMPVVGWIDLVATIVSGQKHVGKALTVMNYSMYQATAIQTYMLYRVSADETRAGQNDLAVMGSVANSLNTSKDTDQGGLSAEQTPLYQKLNGTSAVSSKVKGNPDSCDKGDSVRDGEIVCSRLVVGARGFIEGAQIMSLIANNNPLFIIPGFAADVWVSISQTIGGILGDAAILIIKHSPFAAVYDYVEQHIVELTEKLMRGIVTTIIPNQLGNNPSGGRDYEVGAAGADFLANDYGHTGIGGMRLSDEEAAAIQSEYAAEQQEEFQSKSLYARLTDTSDPSSLISRTALAMPSSSSSGVATTLGSLLTNPVSSLFSSFSSVLNGRTSAANTPTKDPFGITQYGIPKQYIANMGDPEVYAKRYCRDIVAHNKEWGGQAEYNEETGQYENTTPNLCLTLQSTAMAAGGKFDTSLIPNYNAPGDTENSAGGADLRIGSFNVRGSSHTAGDLPGEPGSVRIKGSADFIAEQDFDVVGLQELQIDQRAGLLDRLGASYSIWPDKVDNIHHRNENSILWKDAKKLGGSEGYELVDSGIITGKYQYFYSNPLDVPWVKLKDVNTGQIFVVENTHDPANRGDDANDAACFSRIRNARQHVIDAQQWASQGLPVFITGDYNSAFDIRDGGKDACASGQRENLPYCILTATGDLFNAYDVLKNRSGCPTSRNNDPFIKDKGILIDHVYVTKEVEVSKVEWLMAPKQKNYTDHPVLLVDASIPPNAEVGGAAGGWVWPSNDIYPGPCWNTLAYGYYHAGMDMNTRRYGVAAKAAHAGKVYRVGYDSAAGNYITIKVSDKLYYSYEHLASKPSVSVGDKVVAGQEIGTVGKTGSVNLNASVGHLHMVVSVNGELGSYSTTSQTSLQTRDPLNYLPKAAPNNYTCTK